MTRIYLVRHCESIANLECRFAGHAEYDPSETGYKQLECLAERFKDIKLDKVYSSPTGRAYKTALAENKYSKAPLVTDERLMEVDLGDYDNMLVADVPQDLIHIWHTKLYDFVTPNGETLESVGKRAMEIIKEIVRDNPDKTVGVASHGTFTRALLCLLKKQPLTNIDSCTSWPDNTGVFVFDFEDENNWTIVTENDTSHLTDDCRPLPVGDWK